MNEDHVRQQIAELAVQWRDLKPASRFTQMVERVMAQRGFTDADIEATVGWCLDNLETCPTTAAFLSHMRDQRAQRLERHASRLRSVDHGLPRMIMTARTCTRKGCAGRPELIMDVPEPGSRNRAHARLWCSTCNSSQPIERDLVSGTFRHWLTYEEVDNLMAEPHELRNHPTQGYHHVAEQLAAMRHQLPPVDPSGAAPLRTVRALESPRRSDLIGIGELLGNPGVPATA